MTAKVKTYSYDGYDRILDRVRGIIHTEPITESEKDSLLTKIDGFQTEIEEILSGRQNQWWKTNESI